MKKKSTLLFMNIMIFTILFSGKIDAQWNIYGRIAANSINSVFYINANNVWAVGDNATILKYNGTSWSKQTLPFITSSSLKSVYFLSDTLGWAVGEAGLILKYSGSKWKIETIYGTNDFNSVYFIDKTHGWALGAGCIYSYDGSKWNQTTLDIGYVNITSASFVDSNHGWAVSYGSIIKYNGSTWTIEAPNLSSNLNAICMVSTTDGWAAGYNTIYRYNGSTWTSVPFPSGFNYTTIYSIKMINNSLGWMVGTDNCVLKYNGVEWKKDTTMDSSRSDYFGISLKSDVSDGFIVGKAGTIVKYNGAKWTSNLSFDNTYYSCLAFVDNNHGWCGKSNSIMKYSYGKLVKDSISGYSFYINSINMLDTLHGLAVGSSDKFLQYNGKCWTLKYFNTNKNWYYLNQVKMVDTAKGWAVGSYGLILKFDGKEWKEQPRITTKNLNSVCFIDSTHGWIVGDSGAILKYENKNWSLLKTDITDDLKSVAFSDTSNGWAVGYYEVIMRYSGKTWSLFKRGNYKWSYYNSVKYTKNKWWITGYSKLLTFDGSAWVNGDIDLTGWNYFIDIDYTDSNNGWIITSENLYYTKNGGKIDYSGTNKISIAGRVDYPNVWSFDTVLVLHDIKMEKYLTIRPASINGVKVLFNDNYSFYANKGFSALGRISFPILTPLVSEKALITPLPGPIPGPIIIPVKLQIYPVIFSRLDTTGGKGWGSLTANPDPNDPLDTIRLSYCYFYSSKSWAAVSLADAGVIMNNCLFQKNYGGAYLRGIKSGYINNNTFENIKNSDGALTMSSCTNLSLYGNKFQNNHYGVRIYDNSSAIAFDKNTVSGNVYAGMDISNSTITVKNASICNNGGGIGLRDSRADIFNTIISNNETYNGGGIYCENSVLNVINSTISNNKATYKGGAIYYRFSNGDIYNSILWNNRAGVDTNQIYLYNYGSKPNLYYSDIQGSIKYIKTNSDFETFSYGGRYRSIYNVDPKFIAPSAGPGNSSANNGLTANWRLIDTSACVNKGTQLIGNFDFPDYDIVGTKRVLNGAVDIGAYETALPSFTASCDTIKKSTVWAADTVKINCDVIINSLATLTIMPGTRIEFQGPYRIVVKGSLKAVGTSTDSIKFTLHDTANFFKNNITGWRGIEFDNFAGDMDRSDSSVFKFCKFEFAKYVITNSDRSKGYFGIIRAANFMKISVSNSLFINNISTDNSYTASVIYLSRSAIKLIDDKFLYNQGAVINSSMSNITLNNNLIRNNYSKKEYSSIFYMNGSECTLSNNVFTNNAIISGSILNISSSNGSIVGNVFANNSSDSAYWYGALEANSSNVVIANNTIVNNNNYGIYVFNSKIKVFNNIIWGNYYDFGLSSPGLGSLVSNCNFNTYWGNSEYIVNTVTDTPRFVMPSEGKGKTYNGYKADWRLTQFSPCINKGSSDTAGLKLGSIDISGKNRINGDRIDIGAYEDQGSRLYFKTQPVNIIACNGETIEFSLETSDTAFLQWQKDGVDIPGAKSKKLRILSASPDDEANYSCNATNSYGTVQTNNVYLLIKTAPKILSNPEDVYVGKSRKAVLSVEANGSEPMTYQWYKNNVEMADQKLSILKFDDVTIDNEATYYCKMNNSCGSATTDTVDVTIVPQICMVTVANKANHNLIVWEKNSRKVFDHYNIYREGTVSGYYELIGQRPYDSTTIFEDKLVNPKAQAFLYKITAVYKDGSETDLDYCSAHKTIHLLITKGVPQGYQLDWDEYIGFPYGTYNIYKIAGGSDTSLVHSMASTTRTWTDINETQDIVYYFVSVEKSDGCYPAGRTTTKAGGDIFDQSVSNIEDNRLRSGVELSDINSNELKLFGFPNPYKEFINIKYNLEKPAKVTIELCNSLGKTMAILVNQNQDAGSHKMIINANKYNLADGVYTLKLLAGNKVAVIKLIQTR